MAKEILIPEMSFVGEYVDNYYSYVVQGADFSNETITVEFDGVKYECNLIDDAYGAPYDGDTDTFDFSDYPFSLGHDVDGICITVQDGNEHTIEVYVGEEKEEVFHQHSNVRTQDNQIFYFDENTGDFIFFDGDSWGQNNDAWGKGTVKPKSAIVGTAIVGTDAVGN